MHTRYLDALLDVNKKGLCRWALFLLVPLCYSGPHLTPSSACYSFCAVPLFFLNSALLLIWSSDCYYKFSKMMRCAFSWCSAILQKSFIYLFFLLIYYSGCWIVNACPTPLEPVWKVQSFINYIITFSVPLYETKYV
jgi:hypothetical protein